MSTNETVHPEGLPKDLNISNIISLALESPEHLEYLQGFALRNSEISARFARHVPGANIDNLQVRACEVPQWAYFFAKNIPGADISYCQKHACKSPFWAFYFAQRVKGADLDYCYRAVKGSEYQNDFEEIFKMSGKIFMDRGAQMDSKNIEKINSYNLVGEIVSQIIEKEDRLIVKLGDGRVLDVTPIGYSLTCLDACKTDCEDISSRVSSVVTVTGISLGESYKSTEIIISFENNDKKFTAKFKAKI